MLDQQGFLTLRSACGAAQRVFVDEDGSPLQLNAGTCGSSGRIKLAVTDWDGDSRLDVIVNSENALWYRNCENRGDAIVLKRVGNLTQRNVAGHTSSPAVCDFDNDGKPDLMIGSENGRIYHIRHDDCAEFAGDQIEARQPASPTSPKSNSIVEEEFIFTKAPFDQCHASTICETSRGLVTAWFGGSKEGHDDVGIWTSYHDGKNWTSPVEVADGVQHDGLRYPCWNPVLFQPPGDAPTLLFFKVGPNPRQWWGEMMTSYDRGRTFIERRRLPEGIIGPVRCKPILRRTRDGGDGQTLLCGSSTEHDGRRVHFESVPLIDGCVGESWKRIGPINDGKKFSTIQPSFLQHANGEVQVLCRTQQDVITTSVSSDDGKIWSSMRPLELPNPNSGIATANLVDGRSLLVYNPLDSAKTGWGSRAVLALAISRDGSTWTPAGELDREAEAEFSYPEMIQSSDGRIHIVYTWKSRRIKHVVLDPHRISFPQ